MKKNGTTAVHVLVVGSGAREHALAWKLSESEQVGRISVLPGNGGTRDLAKTSNLVIDGQLSMLEKVVNVCNDERNGIDLVVVGPEALLADGVADRLADRLAGRVHCFGPTRAAARIETSKTFAKEFMVRQKIPTGRFKTFAAYEDAAVYCREELANGESAVVVKADGLAAGKGVFVARSVEAAEDALRVILVEKKFGAKAGQCVVVEQFLEGDEVTVLALTDGTNVVCMPPAQDHKTIAEGNGGPNTGGMGVICPYPAAPELVDLIETTIVRKAVDGLAAEGTPFVGCLYAGLMLTADGPKVLEFNCRFGDPETQVLMPLLESDLYDLLKSCCSKRLSSSEVRFSAKACSSVVLASRGYPGDVSKELGKPIRLVESIVEPSQPAGFFHAGTKFVQREDGSQYLAVSGGRVLNAWAVADTLAASVSRAYDQLTAVDFDGITYRRDIGWRTLVHHGLGAISYAESGVDVAAGDQFVEAIKRLVDGTRRPECYDELGGFAAALKLACHHCGADNMALVSTDGVGTKLSLCDDEPSALECVGWDLVAMCVNDVLCHGGDAVGFLDYLASGKLLQNVQLPLVKGMVSACRTVGCSLVGGETAEMPSIYDGNKLDCAGFVCATVGPADYLPRRDQMAAGDVVVGLSSSGVHSNGFSLIRRIFRLELACTGEVGGVRDRLRRQLLVPTRLYGPAVFGLKTAGLWSHVRGLAHITGGGLAGNLGRILPGHLTAELDATQWTVQPIFGLIHHKGMVAVDEMLRTFNCGLGFVAVVDGQQADIICETLEKADPSMEVRRVGVVRDSGANDRRVEIVNFPASLQQSMLEAFDSFASFYHGFGGPVVPRFVVDEFAGMETMKPLKTTEGQNDPIQPQQQQQQRRRRRVAVLLSGWGSTLQTLLAYSLRPDCSYEIVLVLSNRPSCYGLVRAQLFGVAGLSVGPTKSEIVSFIGDENPTKEQLQNGRKLLTERRINEKLAEFDVELVALAGFMIILSDEFCSKWNGRLINTHPTLLPTGQGLYGDLAHERILADGHRCSGATVHFVAAQVDAGPVIAQDGFFFDPDQTDWRRLKEKVQAVERRLYPAVLDRLAAGHVRLVDGRVVSLR